MKVKPKKVAPKRVQKPAPKSLKALVRKEAPKVKEKPVKAPKAAVVVPDVVVSMKPSAVRYSSDGVCLTAGVVRSSDGVVFKVRG